MVMFIVLQKSATWPLMELRSCQDKTTRAVARYGRLVSWFLFGLVTVDSADSYSDLELFIKIIKGLDLLVQCIVPYSMHCVVKMLQDNASVPFF